jgi:hypothetical protein
MTHHARQGASCGQGHISVQKDISNGLLMTLGVALALQQVLQPIVHCRALGRWGAAVQFANQHSAVRLDCHSTAQHVGEGVDVTTCMLQMFLLEP